MDRTNAHTLRESWLCAVRDRLRPMFDEAGVPIPNNVRVSCGFPSGRALAKSDYRVGECWATNASADQNFEIFLNPRQADPVTVAAVLVHELIHASVGIAAGHRGPFARAARKLGLTGPLTATSAGEELTVKLQCIIDEVGPYPHAEMDVFEESTGPKKQGTRLLKAECQADGCGYTVRVTKKWAERGAPLCPIDDHGAMTIEWPEGEDEEEEGEE